MRSNRVDLRLVIISCGVLADALLAGCGSGSGPEPEGLVYSQRDAAVQYRRQRIWIILSVRLGLSQLRHAHTRGKKLRALL